MTRFFLAGKTILALMTFFFLDLAAFAGGGDDHSHGPEGDHSMQAIGIVVILVLAGAVVWFINGRKK